MMKTCRKLHGESNRVISSATRHRLVVEVFGGFRGVFWRCTSDCDSEKTEMRVGIGKSTKILSHSFCTGVFTCGFAEKLFPKCFTYKN